MFVSTYIHPINMKKLILLLAFSTGFIFSAFAQSSGFGNFNLGLYGAEPLKNMRQIFNEGIGGSLKYEYRLGNSNFAKNVHFLNNLYINLESGYEAFSLKTKLQDPFNPSTYSYVPIKAGVKYYPYMGLYAEGQFGKVLYTQHGGGNSNYYSGGFGYSFNSGFEIGVRYEQWKQTPENHIKDDYGQTGPFAKTSNFSQVAIRLAERF